MYTVLDLAYLLARSLLKSLTRAMRHHICMGKYLILNILSIQKIEKHGIASEISST